MEPYTRKVYYYETDKMAIVHNANYLRIFEEGRLYLMEQLKVPYPDVEAHGILIPVVDAYVRYHQTLKYGDVFCVDTRLTEFNGVKMAFSYEIRRVGDQALIATGHSSHCFISEKTRIPLNIRKKMPEAYEIMMANISDIK